MNLPKDLTGSDLIKLLTTLGYEPTRQTGSHIRLTTRENGTHHITVPNYKHSK
ncbi:MAG: type II toxin-antitoxin system HicA family toxin [Marinoscillum sp.]|uniref:type II toxin-antitoxin system HicA family toxin n=1 Tax=Marinoscillum sp. TaxID=2024838 RepID=UPI0032FA960C